GPLAAKLPSGATSPSPTYVGMLVSVTRTVRPVCTMVYWSAFGVAADEPHVLEYSDPTKFHTPVHGPGGGSVVVVVGGMNGAVVVVVVATGMVLIVVGGEGGADAGHIVFGPNRRHCRTRASRQRLYFAGRKPPHAVAICGRHADRHSALEATCAASAWPLATSTA